MKENLLKLQERMMLDILKEGQEAIEAGEAEEPKPLDVTEFEIEDDEEQKTSQTYEHWLAC